MTVSATTNKAGPYLTNGYTTTFPFAFPFTDADQISVLRTDLSTGAETALGASEYTVSSPGDTGSVVLADTLPAGYSITVVRTTAQTQELDLVNQGGWFPEAHESAFDKLTMIVQETTAEVGRALKIPASSSASAELPAPVAGTVIGSTDGESYENISLVSQSAAISGDWTVDRFVGGIDFTAGVTDVLTLSKAPATAQSIIVTFDGAVQGFASYNLAATTLTFSAPIPPGTSLVEVRIPTTLAVGVPDGAITAEGSSYPRKTSVRAGEVANVKDYGALGDGVTDDTLAIQAAIDAAGADGRTVYIPAGQYIVNGTLTVTTQAYSFGIRGDGWGSELRRQSGNVGPMLRIINPGAPSYFQGGTIEDLNILSDSPSDANVGIKLADGAATGPVVNLRFRNVMINNFARSVENNCESNEINWYDCWLVSGGYGVYDNYGGADWRFFGCHFQALTNWAIYGKMSSVTIVGCTQQSYRDGAKGFYLEDGRCHIIQGCYFEGEPNIGGVAIPPYPADGQSGVIGDGQSIAIQFAGDNRGSLIASNNFDMFYGRAIVVNKTDGLTIIGNYFQKCQIGIQLAAEALNVEIGAQSWMPECVVPISYDNPGVTAQSLPHFSGDHKKVIGSPDLGYQDRDDWPSLPAFSVVGTLGAEAAPGGDAASTPEVNSTGSWVNYGGTLTTMASVNTPYTPPDGSYMLRFAGPNGAKAYLALTTVVGQVYRVTFKAKKEAGSPVCVISDAAGDTYSTATQRRHHFLTRTRGYELVTLTFVATATTTYLLFIMVGASECFVDTLSVKPATSGSVAAYSGEFTYLNGRKVVIGAPNSGGAGYRTFLVEN